MKKYFVLWLVICLSLAGVPLCVMNAPGQSAAEPQTEKESPSLADGQIAVYMAESRKTETMEIRDYVIGVTAAEMPVAFEKEALCAQAISSLTLAEYFVRHPEEGALTGASVSTDPAVHQAYMSVAEMKKKWGKDFNAYYEKLTSAVDEVIRYMITYDGEPILAAFHAVSPGKTEAAENLWQAGLPYLVSVDSAEDRFSPKYSSSVTVSRDEFCEKLGLSRMDSDGGGVGEGNYTEAGTLLAVKIGGQTFSGADLRKAFGLQSNAVTVSYADGNYTLNVKGYGHGIGLSQYGADRLARDGGTWREIIAHYYPGTEISDRVVYG